MNKKDEDNAYPVHKKITSKDMDRIKEAIRNHAVNVQQNKLFGVLAPDLSTLVEKMILRLKDSEIEDIDIQDQI